MLRSFVPWGEVVAEDSDTHSAWPLWTVATVNRFLISSKVAMSEEILPRLDLYTLRPRFLFCAYIGFWFQCTMKTCTAAWGLEFWLGDSSHLGSSDISGLCRLSHGPTYVRRPMLASCSHRPWLYKYIFYNVAGDIWEPTALLWWSIGVIWNTSQFECPGF